MSEENLREENADVMETIIMKDDEGGELEFFVINGAEENGTKYFLVVLAEDYDKDEPDAYVIKEVKDEGDEVSFEFVEDENEYAAAVVLMSEDDNDYEIVF